MVLRFLLRYLSNNEQLVQKLSESYPMRRAAQWVVYAFHQGKNVYEESGLRSKMSPEQFRDFIQKISQNLQRELKQKQDDFKKKF